MIAEELKRAILQAAIQGKLTEQLPEDGDARDLLKEIQRARPFSEITEDDMPFNIPENWCWVRLEQVFEIARGGSPRPIQAFLTTNSDGINWIKIGDTDIDGKYLNETKRENKTRRLEEE